MQYIALMLIAQPPKNKTPDEISKETLSQIISCFENGDNSELKKMMSDYIINNDSQLDNEIEEAFDFIDGKIVSYDNPFANAMGSHEKKPVAVELQTL